MCIFLIYISIAYNCVKCGGPHDTQSCKKTKQTPAKCVLCEGAHPANYKGCTVYRDLTNLRANNNTRTQARHTTETQPANNRHQQGLHSLRQNTVTYAQAASGAPVSQSDTTTSSDLAEKMSDFLKEFKIMFTQLINQNSMILNMLTSVIHKITQ